MRISVHHHSKWLKEAGEIKCPWNQLGLVLPSLRENPDPRLVIVIPEEISDSDKFYQQVSRIKELEIPYTIETGKIDFCRSLLSDGYHAYLRYPVTDWETFNQLKSLGVSDIWIDGPLCFQADNLSKAIADTDIVLRVCPVNGTATAITNKRAVTSFYLRPEDKAKLPIGVIDFQLEDKNREDVLYSIYKRGNFIYGIGELFPGLPTTILNTVFTDDFGTERANCGQRCQIPGHTCHYCNNYFRFIEQVTAIADKS